MKLLEKILMPIDVNKSFDKQLKAAIEIAKNFHSAIGMMYVLPDTVLHDDIKTLVLNSVNESLDKAKEVFEKKGITTLKPIVELGEPVDKILQKANEGKFNLILVSSGEKDENEQYKLGITAEKLIRLSDIPVWVAKSNQESNITNILCPVDFSDPSRRALKNSILLSKNFKAKLHVLGVYEPITIVSPRLSVDLKKENADLRKQFEKQMDEFLIGFDFKGIDHTKEIQTGNAHQKILHAINEYGCDLLIMGTNGRTGFSRIMMGSVTEKVTREVPCSFITTKMQDIFKLKFDNEIKDIEEHFNYASDLFKSGLNQEAIDQYRICLQINDMHIPSMYKLAELYKTMGETIKVTYYEKMAKDLLTRIWDKKIELEIRKHYRNLK
jgi:nucleotide-binding universal stress UspA family protein